MIEARRAQYVMGTTVEIVVRDVRGASSDVALGRAFAEFERLERAFSVYDPASELSRVNRDAAARAVRVSDEVFEIVARGVAYSRASAGCFSIALGPLCLLWERAIDEGRELARDEVVDALALASADAILLDAEERTIAFARPGMALDFGGLVKGTAVDLALASLRRDGVEHAYVSAGESSVGTLGDAGDGAWRVGVRHPADGDRIVGELALADFAVSTSGTGERGAWANGVWRSHVVDPRVGEPVEGFAAATVTCASAEHAEVASKLLLLLGCEDGLAACDVSGWEVEGLYARADGASGEARVERSAEFPAEIYEIREYDTVSAAQE